MDRLIPHSTVPVCFQFKPMEVAPFLRQPSSCLGQITRKHSTGCNLNFRLVLGQDHMEMRWRAVTLIHVDLDAIEQGNRWQSLVTPKLGCGPPIASR